MPIDSTFLEAVSLTEYRKTYPEGTGERAFIETFARASDLSGVYPMRRAGPGGKHKFWRTAVLPGVQHRAYNEPGNTSSGKSTKFEEGTYLMDEYVIVDRAQIDDNPNERAKQEMMKAIAMSRHFSDVLVHGDNTSEPREPSGFRARCTRADINLFHNSASSGGGALSLVNLGEAINSVNRPTHLLMPRVMRPFWEKAAKDPNLSNTAINFNSITSDLGRVVIEYQGLPILWGYEPDDGADLTNFDEVASGGGDPVTGSIYVLSLGEGKLFGIESVPLTVTDEGQIPAKPAFSTHIKWDFGFVEEHPRSMARLDSITKATIVA